ncbi:hypothetical protein TSUD_18160 [Trifolium subterraneum]|uniref:Uncharacterized protein n=1 Tax=Trifolium subterraneum TaxID=3900 RepID=A0A2Z6NUN3_TRISU|nr:hypothetical protein TSUD_18160 [Trifolium subterraneum]
MATTAISTASLPPHPTSAASTKMKEKDKENVPQYIHRKHPRTQNLFFFLLITRLCFLFSVKMEGFKAYCRFCEDGRFLS